MAKKLKEKRINLKQQIEMRYFEELVEIKAFRLLGAFWKEYIEWYFDKTNDDFVMRYY